MNIAVVAIVDTDSDPDLVQYAIPGNDDAIRSVKLITGIITDSVIEGSQKIRRNVREQKDEIADAAQVVVAEAKEGIGL